MTKGHAERVREVFEEMFPQHVDLLQVIHYGMERVHDGPYGDGLISKFKKQDKPRIAEGHLYQQIKNAVTKTTELVEGIQKLGPKGLEAIKYPPETLHEIVTNALLHRDYSIPVDVHIRIFDNRIEVESPGKLPGHINHR